MAKKVYIGVQTISNMVYNGTFANLDGWTTSIVGSNYANISNGTLYLTVPTTSTTYKRVYTSNKISLISGHKYYCSVQVKKTGGGITRWGMHNESDNITRWVQDISDDHSALTKISYLYTSTADMEANFLLYSVGKTWASGMTVTWDNLFVVDLTALYGAGNEPTQSQCDSRFSMNASTGVVSCTDNVGGVAHKIKKIYIGVDGVARRVKKAYIGVEGVARCFWSGSPITITKIGNGTINSGYTGYGLINPRVMAIGNSYFAVGGGSVGENGGSATQLQIFDKTGTEQSKTCSISSSQATAKGGCESVGSYGVYYGGSSTVLMKAIDTSLTDYTINFNTNGVTTSILPKIWGRLPNYAICVYSKSFSLNESLTYTRLSQDGDSISHWGASGCGNSYVIAYKSYNSFISYDTSLTYQLVTNGVPFDSRQAKGNVNMVPHVNGTIVIANGQDTDDGEEYDGDDILFVNTSLTTSHWGTKGTYEYPACRMRLAGKSICCGHGQSDNTDKWTWVWDESLTRTYPEYVTAAACGGASSISEDWGVISGGVRLVDGTDKYAYYGMNILTT